MDSNRIAQILREISVYLQLTGENPFKIRAYDNAAHTIETLSEDLGQLIQRHQLASVKGIGPSLAEAITTLYKTGDLPYYQSLKASVPAGLIECLEIPGLGPKKLYSLYVQLQIRNMADLKAACEANKVGELAGFGAKTQANLLLGIERYCEYGKRHLRAQVEPIVQLFLSRLQSIPEVEDVACAGSFRRGLETVGDLDFIAASCHSVPVMTAFISSPDVLQITAHGETKSSVRLQSGLQVDLRVVPPAQYPFALHHFTGSKDHNIQLRSRALSMGLSLSEWGLRPAHSEDDYETLNVKTEVDLFKKLNLAFIPPELREGMNEVSLTEQHALPHLIEKKDIRGAFHNHTTESDGADSLEAMARAADELGWEYLGIADHSKSSFQAHGLSPERLEKQVAAIHRLNASGQFKVHLFAGTECDILPDGQLDYDDDCLKQLDYVVASVHSAFTQDEDTMTARIIRALENPYVTMLGHVSGRLLLKREAYKINITKIIDAAIANGKIIEFNAQPLRLDMDWRFWRQRFDRGLLCSINPDAHSTSELDYVYQSLPTARKGALTCERVFNTKSLTAVKAYFVRNR